MKLNLKIKVKLCLIIIFILVLSYIYYYRKKHKNPSIKYNNNLHQKAFLIEIDNFLNDDEINGILKLGIPDLKASNVMGKEKNEVDESIRKSETTYLNDTNLLINIKKKASNYTKLDWFNAESLQLLRYKPGGKYQAHWDYFIEPEGDNYKNSMKQGGQRIYTFFIYLNDDFTGGETEFPKLNRKIKPKKGKAVFWKNLLDDGTPNEFTLHSGNTVHSGIKYGCNLWIRERQFKL